MQGSWNHGRPYYRCRYPAEYALAEEIDHPKAVYLQEQEVVPALDRWIARVFEPDRLEATCRKLAGAQDPSVEDEARLGAIREALAEATPGWPGTAKPLRPAPTRGWLPRG